MTLFTVEHPLSTTAVLASCRRCCCSKIDFAVVLVDADLVVVDMNSLNDSVLVLQLEAVVGELGALVLMPFVLPATVLAAALADDDFAQRPIISTCNVG